MAVETAESSRTRDIELSSTVPRWSSSLESMKISWRLMSRRAIGRQAVQIYGRRSDPAHMHKVVPPGCQPAEY